MKYWILYASFALSGLLLFGAGAVLDGPIRRLFTKPQANNALVTRTAFIARFPGETKIVMLGDSLIMRGDWSLLLPEFSIANHGVDGNTSTDILKR
ncbi:MAG: hypothetical protein E2O93_06535, partial [Alphaproteobacteria bacterium]